MAVTAPPLLTELPYRPDSAALFEAVADDPWSMFLDSAGRGRFDVIVADPALTLVSHGGVVTVTPRDGAPRVSDGDLLATLRERLGPAVAPMAELPFLGGAVGYFAYDFGWRLDDWPETPRPFGAMPEAAVGLFDWAVVVDHRHRRSRLVSMARDPKTAREWPHLIRLFRTPPEPSNRRFEPDGAVVSNLDRAAYLSGVRRIQDYLRAGDCYQVNFAQTFRAGGKGDPWQAYRRLRTINPAPYAAYLNTPFGQVLSASPERFLEVRDRRVQTRPIKGTRPRSPDRATDRALAGELARSTKDRAENVMIVDLLRNDLGKSCKPGSVQVPDLFRVESFASVHHLVSTVTGELAEGRDALHLLADCFPGGSITGAPKRRAMEIIAELEPEPRGLYCGSIGYLGYDGSMDTNIAIRTLTHVDGEMRFGAGGGIVIDSDPEAEYQESLDKAARLIALFETGRTS